MSRDTSTEQRTVEITAVVRGPDTLLLRRDAGTATAGDEKWELALDVGSGFPIVRGPDGRWVLFDWQALLAAASRALTEPSKRFPTWDELEALVRAAPNKPGVTVRLLNIIHDLKSEGANPEEALVRPRFLAHRNAGRRTYDHMMNLVLEWRQR